MKNRLFILLVPFAACLSVLGYAAASFYGTLEPFELFNLLLITSIVIAGIYPLARKSSIIIPLGMIVLVSSHLFFIQGTAPDKLTSGAILLANLLVFYTGQNQPSSPVPALACLRDRLFYPLFHLHSGAGQFRTAFHHVSFRAVCMCAQHAAYDLS